MGTFLWGTVLWIAAAAAQDTVTLRLRNGSQISGSLEAVRDGRYWLRLDGEVRAVPVGDVLEVVLPSAVPIPPPAAEIPPVAPPPRPPRAPLWEAALRSIREARRLDVAADALRRTLTEAPDDVRMDAAEAALARIGAAIHDGPAREATEALIGNFTAAIASHEAEWGRVAARLRQLWAAWIERLDRAGAPEMRARAVVAAGRWFPEMTGQRGRDGLGPEIAYIEELAKAGLLAEAREEIERLRAGRAGRATGLAAELPGRVSSTGVRWKDSDAAALLDVLARIRAGAPDESLRGWAAQTAWELTRDLADGAPPDRALEWLERFLAGEPPEPWAGYTRARRERLADAAEWARFVRRLEGATPQEALAALSDFLAHARDTGARVEATARVWPIVEPAPDARPDVARPILERFLNAQPEEPWRSRAQAALAQLGRDEEFDRMAARIPGATVEEALELLSLLLARTEDRAKRWMVCGRVWDMLERAAAERPPAEARALLLRYTALGPEEPWRSRAADRIAAMARTARRDDVEHEVSRAEDAGQVLALLRGFLAEEAQEEHRRWAWQKGWEAVVRELATAPPRRAQEILEQYLALSPSDPWRAQATEELDRVRAQFAFDDLRGRVARADAETALTLIEGFLAQPAPESWRRWAFDAAWGKIEAELMRAHDRGAPLLERFLRLDPPEPWAGRARRWREVHDEGAMPPVPRAPAPPVAAAAAPAIGQGEREVEMPAGGVAEWLPVRPGAWYEYRTAGGRGWVRVEYREPWPAAAGMVRLTQVSSTGPARFVYVSSDRIEVESGGERLPLLVAPLESGARWEGEAAEGRRETWNVVDTGAKVTLSNGRTYDDCLVVENVVELRGPQGARAARLRSTYARGIGLVRQEWPEDAGVPALELDGCWLDR